MSEDMSLYCSVHDEWLIMKFCRYVGYHDANNVSNFGGDPVTQLNLKKMFYGIIYAALRTWRSIAASVATRPRPDCSSMECHTSLSTVLVYVGHGGENVHAATFKLTSRVPVDGK